MTTLSQILKSQTNLIDEDKHTLTVALHLFGAGKTTLVSSMRSIYGRKRDRARALFTGGRTQGIEVQAIEKDGIKVSLWDMAGQQEFHAFHDCMFPDIGTSSYQFPSMFMFVWSPMDSQSNKIGGRKQNEDFQASFRY